MNIVFLDASMVGDIPNLYTIEKLGNLICYPFTHSNKIADRVQHADIIITNKVVLDREILTKAEKIKLICVAATGMNNIDRNAAKEMRIPVKNVAGYAAQSVAQCTFAMILRLTQNITFYDNFVKNGEYAKSDIFTNVDWDFYEISGKRFGIIGLGTIGRKMAEIAEAFGADVIYYSTSGRNTDQPYPQVDLDELLRTSDIVSIHAPLNANTENLINYECIKLMKQHAILVNTGRGGIINEEDLAKALDEDLIKGAALDVFENEPIDAGNPLLSIQNPEKLILTPHIAWVSFEARMELIEGVRKNIEDFLNG